MMATLTGSQQCSATRQLGLADISGAPRLWKAIERGATHFVQRASERLDRRLFSRLIAKIALEQLAERVHMVEGWEEFAIDHPQFDPIRAYARYGTGPDWPIHSRRIYDEDATIALPSGEAHQVVYECDILLTDIPEGFAVVCLFGVEHTINLTRRDVSGFVDWIRANAGISPLSKGSTLRRRMAPE